jgi:hypothetical protein
MYSKYNIFAIYLLISIYLIMNLVYKKILNILIFLISFIVADKCLNNKYTALIIAYALSISYGIIKNFHLLENFAIKDNNNIQEENLKDDPVYKKMNTNTDMVIKLNAPTHSIISEHLLKKFIDKCKKEDNSVIYTRKVKIIDLRPTINELSNGKIKKMLENKMVLGKTIVISNDNYIIDGHHRWYANKSKIVGRKEDDDESAFIKATIINMPVEQLLRKIKVFKQDHNESNMGRFNVDHTKIQNAKSSIKLIQDNINILDTYIQDLNGINLV